MRIKIVQLPSYYLMIPILICGVSSPVHTQTHKLAIGTGRFQLTVASVITANDVRVSYPREYEVYQLKYRYFTPECADGGGIVIAARDFQAKALYSEEVATPTQWTIKDTLLPYVVADATACYTVDAQHTTVPIDPGAQRYWKYRPPARVVDRVLMSVGDWVEGRDVDGPADMPTDQMGSASCKTSMGITVTERAWVFDIGEFAIVEYVFKYSGQTGSYDGGEEITYSDPINDCYIGVKFRPVICGGTTERVVPNSGGWKEGTDEWVDYVHTEDDENLRILYGWDGDAGDFFLVEDDEGDPLYQSSGLFSGSQYPGMAVLHADRSTEDHTDDPLQPHRFHVSYGGTYSSNVLSMGGTLSFQDIYQLLDAGPDSPSPFDWAGWKDAGYPSDDGPFWYYGTNHATEDKRFNQMGTLGFGPYNFDLGDSIRVILCYAVGTIDWPMAISLGAQYKDGTITRGEKNEILRSGRDSLFARIKWVKGLFEDRLESNLGDMQLTLQDMSSELGVAPAWPDSLIIEPLQGRCRVRWFPVEDAVAYRVYRRSRIDFDAMEPRMEPAYVPVYQCGGDDPGGTMEWSPSIDSTAWVDRDVYEVFNYWYYVTAVGSDGTESSHFIGRTNPKPQDNTFGSVRPFDRERYSLEEVHVLPNPYNARSRKLYDWPENVLRFVGLPANCRIRIFSQNGVLIFKDYHKTKTDLPESSYDWEMRSATDQTVASGLYVYVIDQCKDLNGNELDVSKIGKFVVIK
ncbi:MAG: hypothetical protein JSU61_11970 [Fidelibacterota bacterium]|nr:MAG: hypothetical protein JSU61_11970 [Candidatus Neomarinimicrobiota bacterium]